MSDYDQPGQMQGNNQNIALRPLNKGMMRNISPQLLPMGAFYDVQNAIVTENGPLRRPGFKLSGAQGTALDTAHWPLLDAFRFNFNGSNEILVITSTSVVKFDFITGFSTITGGTDIFTTDKISNVDWAVIDNAGQANALFADGSGYIYVYNGSDVSEWDATYASPKVLEWAENRVFIGAPSSSEGNKLVWSGLNQPTSLGAGDYVIFSDQQDTITRVKKMGNLLVVFFPQGIYFGRPTNQYELPFAFTMVQTGGIGLVGKKAVTEYDDGLFFVGQDDVYFFSANSSLIPVGSPIVNEMIKDCSKKEAIYCATDPVNDSLIVGVPGASDTIEELWYFNYKAKAWSHSPLSCDMIATLGIYTSFKWTDAETENDYSTNPDNDPSTQTMTLNGTEIDSWGNDAGAALTDTFATAGFPTWRSLEQSISVNDLFIASDGQLFFSDDLSSGDDSAGLISYVIETGDIDLNAPDTDKTFNRLSLKVDRIMDTPITFDVFTSRDRGRNWIYRGAMRVEVDSDETYVNFRAKGSTCRFRISSVSECDPYIVNEIIIRGRGRGLQTDGGGV